MTKSKVAILRTTPGTVLADYHRLLNLAGYQDVIAKDADTTVTGTWISQIHTDKAPASV